MPLTERQIEKLKRIESRGHPIDWTAANRAFNLTCSPITTVGVEHIDELLSLADTVTTSIEEMDRELALEDIVLRPTICDPVIVSPSDKLTHKRKMNGYVVVRSIDFDSWRRARRSKRLQLAVENFEACLVCIPSRHLPIEERELLVSLVHKAAAKLRSGRTAAGAA
jgi:hypothetical protein